jgi:ABC-2 type transport system permease protein
VSAWRAELLKVATVRAQCIGALLAAVAIPVTSLLVVATGRLGSADTVTSGAATGSVIGLLAFGAWGGVLAAGEFTTQTIVVSLATVPRRIELYAAKLAATAAVAGAGALVSSLAALLIVVAVEAPGAHALGNPAALVSVVLAAMAVAVVGAAVGVLTRSPSASIVIVVAAVLLPRAAGGLLGGMQPWVIGASPGTVITQVVGGAQLPANQSYPAGAWAAAATMILVAAVVCGGGAVAFLRRDT